MGFADMARNALKEIMQAEKTTTKEQPRPYFGSDGSLIIPFRSAPRFHWWAGGQSIKDTIEEIKALVH